MADKDNDDTAGSMETIPPREPTWVDRWETRLSNVARAVGAVFSVPFTAALGLAGVVLAQLSDFIEKHKLDDPFRLRVNGTTLLSEHVRKELGFLTLLIASEVGWEMFCWTGMWGYSIDGIVWILVSLAFTALTGIMTRMLLTMASAEKRRDEALMIVRRLVNLTLVAIVLMIPTELRFFRQEIEAYISAQEDVRFDEILAKAKAYETKLADTRTDAADATLSGKDEQVTARRAEERKALVAQQMSDRASIERRLTATSDDAVRETAGKKYGGHGIGPNAILLNRQVEAIRKELAAFDADARAERTAFEAKTQEMTTDALKAVTDAHASVATTFDEKMHGLETTDRDELARQYGGTWRLSRGILDQWHAYVEILRAPELDASGKPVDQWMTSNQKFAAGVAIMMVVFSLGVLFVRLGLTEPTRQYYDPFKQALAGNEEMLLCVMVDARNGNVAALEVLRSLAGTNREAEAVLRMRGYDGNLEAAGWSPEKFQLHERFGTECEDADRDYRAFEEAFRDLCGERVQRGRIMTGVDRSEIARRGQNLWVTLAQKSIAALSQTEREMFTKGFKVPPWPSELVQGDPRTTRPLWELDDDALEEQFGWVSPTRAAFHHAPTA